MSKRLFDILLALFGLVVFSPVIAVCAIVAGLDAKGFGIYSQVRVGRHGATFNVYKVRTMYATALSNETTITVSNDSRITRSGRVMRRFKLDELPQLYNVLVGHMSLVGPRPDVPGYADNLTGSDLRILELRPGITGPATIKYTNEEEILAAQHDPVKYNDTVVFPDKVKINIEYLENYRLIDDIRYILMTLRMFKVPPQLRYTGAVEE